MRANFMATLPKASCAALHDTFDAARLQLNDDLACAWCAASRLRTLRLVPVRQRLNDMWLLRWWLASELLRLRLASVLILDMDVHLAADPFPLLLEFLPKGVDLEVTRLLCRQTER